MNRIIPDAAAPGGTSDDGPHALAEQAAEAVRALNHATLPGRAAYLEPADASATLGELQRLAEMLPQALEQAGDWLQAEARAGRVESDVHPGDPANGRVAVSSLVLALESAREYAEDLATALNSARNISTHLRGVRS